MSSGNDALREAVRALAGETRQAEASPRVKSVLLKEIRARRRRAAAARWWPMLAAVAAVLVVGIWMGRPKQGQAPMPVAATVPPVQLPQELSVTVPEPDRVSATLPAARPARLATVRQLTPLTPWYVHSGLIPQDQGQVVYLDVGPDIARRFGLQLSGPLKAEVFLGNDGMARAFRLVRTPQIAKGE